MQKPLRLDFGAVVLSVGLLFPVGALAADPPMKLACKYDSASLSDTAKEKGYEIDCRTSTDDRCPLQHYVLDNRWKIDGDNAVMDVTVTSGLGERSVQRTTINRATLQFTFRWELASKEKPAPVLSGEGKCAPEG